MPGTESSPRSKRDIALRRCKRAFIFTLCFEAFSWPLRYYEFIIYAHLPTFFFDYGPATFSIASFSIEIYSFYLAIRYFLAIKLRALYPFAIVALSYLIINHTTPYTTNISSYHDLYKNDREAVVADFCSGKLSLPRGDCERCLQLPSQWRHLSLMSDHVDIECDETRSQALFYTQWGFFSYWEALLFRANGSYPDDPLLLRSYKITRLDDNWFYIVH